MLGASRAAGAQALVAMPDEVEVAALACLTRPGPPVRWDAATAARRGLIRLALRFTGPDTPPGVSVISNSLGPEAEALVLDRVSAYRMPCLAPSLQGQGVEVLQEFRSEARAADIERPLRLMQGALPPSACLVQPPANEVLQRLDRLPTDFFARVMIQSRFVGGPEDPPQNLLMFSSAPQRLSAALMKRAEAIRLVCRKPGDRPQTLRQSFVFEVGRVQRQLPPAMLSLQAWLQLMEPVGAPAVEFDFDTMRCPFEIEWRSLLPAAANEARAAGRPAADRAEFLAWAGTLRLAGGEARATDWFGERLRVQVPCGAQLLHPGIGTEAR